MSVEEIPLEDYPVKTIPGKVEVLDARTMYRFKNPTETDGRWQAVCLLKSTYERKDGTVGTSNKIRVYRWQWRQKRSYNPDTKKSTPYGEYSWMVEETLTINQVKYAKQIMEIVGEFSEELG